MTQISICSTSVWITGWFPWFGSASV